VNVIWDLGNVILHWSPHELIDGLPISGSQKQKLMQLVFEHKIWNELDAGHVTEREVVSNIVSMTDLPEKLLIHVLDEARASLRLIEPSICIMKELSVSGIPQYCLSNMSNETYEHIKNWPFFELFKGIVISAQEGLIKPDPEIFNRLLIRYGLQADQTLFIDDNRSNIKSASNLGMKVVLFDQSEACYEEIRNLAWMNP